MLFDWTKKIKYSLLVFCLLVMLPIQGHAVENPSSIVTYTNISSRIVAYQGNSVAGFTTISVETEKPTVGNINIIGENVSIKINLSYEGYKKQHRVNWAPWNDSSLVWAPLAPGEYTVTLNLTDEGHNQYRGISLGKITVVEEVNPKPILEKISASSPIISPKYGEDHQLTTINYQINRPARVKLSINGERNSYNGTEEILNPGNYQIKWNGRDDEGDVVPDGNYTITFETRELAGGSQLNYFFSDNAIKVEGGEHRLPQWRMNQIISNVSLDRNEASLLDKSNGILVSGQFTLLEDATINIWMVNAAGVHVSNLSSQQQVLKAGKHNFSWNGKDFMGSDAMNGTYRVKVTVVDKQRVMGDEIFNSAVIRVKDGYEVKTPKPEQWVRVSVETTAMTVLPYSQGYKGKAGDMFPLLEDITNISGSDRYSVLVAGEVPGSVKVGDVELINLDRISVKWGYASQTKVDLMKEPTMNQYQQEKVESISLGTAVRILTTEGDWYRILSPQGRQLYVKTTDLSLNAIQPKNNMHTVVAGDTLWKIAQQYKLTVEALVNENNIDLNKHLFIGQQLLVPELAKPSPPHQEVGIIYEVKVGDSLWKIAQAHNITVEILVEANKINPTHHLMIGQKLIIPNQQKKEANDTIDYTVKAGDSLWKIAQTHNITVEILVEANKINPSHQLMIGQKLIIPNQQKKETNERIIYTVKAGDSLWKIAQAHNTTVVKIATLSGIDPNNQINIGQQISIPLA